MLILLQYLLIFHKHNIWIYHKNLTCSIWVHIPSTKLHTILEIETQNMISSNQVDVLQKIIYVHLRQMLQHINKYNGRSISKKIHEPLQICPTWPRTTKIPWIFKTSCCNYAKSKTKILQNLQSKERYINILHVK